MSDDAASRRIGLFGALAAYAIWGAYPIYFVALSHVHPMEFVAHRILGALLCLSLCLPLAKGAFAELAAVRRSPKSAWLSLLAAALIGGNWTIYVIAATSERILEASLGYFMTPLFSVALGVAFLGERLGWLRALAVILAGAAVARLALGAPSSLALSAALGGSFSLYGLARRYTPLGAVSGLWLECLIASPIAIGLLLFLGAGGGLSMFSVDRATDLLLLAAGPVTIAPLLLFTAGAKRIDYSTIGMMMYIVPSALFLQGFLVFDEPLEPAKLQTFAVIWAALALYGLAGLRRSVQ